MRVSVVAINAQQQLRKAPGTAGSYQIRLDTHTESIMKKLAMIAAAAAFLATGTAAFAQASGAMSNDSMSHGAMSNDKMSHDSMSKDGMSKDKMKHDKMKKGGDAMGMGHEASGAMGQ